MTARAQNPTAAESRSTGFVAAEDARGAPAEVRVFGGVFVVLWTALMVLLFITRRRHRALRDRVERLEESLDL